MNPVRLRLSGFRTYGEVVDVDLPAGCVAITGDNGAGKSSLVQGIEIALFGPESRSLAPYLNPDMDDLLIELEFFHAAALYRVRRAYTAKGKGKTTFDLEVQYDPETAWESLTLGTAADTQEAIEKLIGLTRDTYRASSYLAQGDGAAFTEALPRDRKRILGDVLGLARWEQRRDQVASDSRELRHRSIEITTKTELLNERVAGLDEAEKTAKTLALELAACEGDHVVQTELVELLTAQADSAQRMAHEHQLLVQALETAEVKVSAARRVDVEAQVARERADGFETDRARLEALAGEHADLMLQVSALGQQQQARADALREKNQLTVQIGALTDELGRKRDLLEETNGKILHLRTGGEHARCDRCEQVLGAALETAVASLESERAGIDAALADLTKRRQTLQQAADQVVVPAKTEGLGEKQARLVEIAGAPAELARVQGELAALARTIEQADSPEHKTELALLLAAAAAARESLAETEPPDPAAAARIRNEATDAKRRLAELATIRDGLRSDQARAQLEYELALAAKAEMATLVEDLEWLSHELDLISQLEQAFSRDGVPAWIVEQQAIPHLEQEATRVLQILGGPITSIELRTQRELKGGGVADALDIVCDTAQGERDYATFSGGERSRASIALRLGLAQLLAQRRGGDVRTLILDEPDSLDEQGMGALANVLRGLVNRGVFDATYLVSHVATLRDAFDQSLIVTRKNGRSEVTAA